MPAMIAGVTAIKDWISLCGFCCSIEVTATAANTTAGTRNAADELNPIPATPASVAIYRDLFEPVLPQLAP